MQHACKPRHEFKSVFEKIGKCKTGRRLKDNINTDRKELGVEKFTWQKEGYPERGNELFLATDVGLFYKNLLYSSTKLLQLCKKCFQSKKKQ
jgi:hypothetical protein